MAKKGRITEGRIDLEELLDSVRDEGAGATVLFLGTVREMGDAGRVDRMTYESYAPMAERRLSEIEGEVFRLWPAKKVRIQHRVGELNLGEVSVAVAVSAPHRAEAFDACRHAMERIKRDVPIWKKERLASGEEAWVEGKRMGARPRTGPRS